MTDQEILATFMEPRPSIIPGGSDRILSPGGWWRLALLDAGVNSWHPRILTLNECHLIEARLSDEQWQQYYDHLWADWQVGDGSGKRMRLLGVALVHASPESKIAALASVLRKEVQGG